MNKLDTITIMAIVGASFVAYAYYRRKKSRPQELTMNELLTRPGDYIGKTVTIDGVTGIFT